MPKIDTRMMFHRLDVDPPDKRVLQRKHNVGDDKRVAIDEEVGKLSSIGFIT